MSKLRVDRSSNNLTINLAEFLNSIVESYDLSGTDKGKIQWVEEQNHIFAYMEEIGISKTITIKSPRTFVLPVFWTVSLLKFINGAKFRVTRRERS